MSSYSNNDKKDILAIVGDVVSSYVSKNSMHTEDMNDLIISVYETFINLSNENVKYYNRQEPTVPVENSVTPDYIICLEDGKKLKMLKRHLRTTYDMTPNQYRQKWNLGPDYPMVAPNYAEKRSNLAKHIKLGKRGRKNTSDIIA